MLDFLPEDVSKIIYRNVHEMYMKDMIDELHSVVSILHKCMDYMRCRAFYPYLILDRIYNEKTDYPLKKNIFFRTKIDRYIHYKKMKRCLEMIVKPEHLFFDKE